MAEMTKPLLTARILRRLLDTGVHARAERLLARIHPADLGPLLSDLTPEEIRTAINRVVTDARRFQLIPVRLPGVKSRPGESELPSFLANRQWVEFRESLEDEDSGQRLISGLRGKEPGFGLASGHTFECPYKGLGVFDINDAPYFCGREAVTE